MQQKEKYPGLLCHGPLALVLLLELLRINVLDTGNKRKWTIRQFDYKCLAPMYVDQVRKISCDFIFIITPGSGWLIISPRSNSGTRSVAAGLAIRPTNCGLKRRRMGIVLKALQFWRKIHLEDCNQYSTDKEDATRLSNFRSLQY